MSERDSPALPSDPWSWVTLAGYLLVLVLIVIPLATIFLQSVRDPATGAWTLEHLRAVLDTPSYRTAVWHSLVVSVGGALGAIALGLPLALLTTRFVIRGRTALTTLAVLSLLSPPFIGAYAWILLLGSNGLLRRWVAASLGVELPTIYGPGGIVLVYSLQYYPFVFLLTAGALRTIDRSLLEASANLGVVGAARLRRVVLPLVLPSLSAGALIALLLSLANFGTPMILGRGYRVLPTVAYDLFTSEVGRNTGLAATVCLLLIGVSSLAVLAQRWVAGRRDVASNLVRRAEPERLSGASNLLAHALCYAIVGFSTLPLVVVALTSFRNTSGPVFQPGFGLQSYRSVISGVPRAITNSLAFSLLAAALIVVIGVALGYVLSRRQNPATRLLDPLLMSPYLVPGVVLGVGFVIALPQALLGTGLILVLAYLIRRLPYTVRSSASILQQVDPAIEEAAINLGAPPGRAFFSVTLPLMAPGILAGAILSWVTAVSELSASIVLYVGRTITMPVKIYLQVLDGDFGPAAALSTILLAVTGAALYAVFALRGEDGLAEV